MGIGGCGSFYAITIASQAFKGLSIVKQHRLVNDALKKEIEGIHGLQVCFPPCSNAPLQFLLAHPGRAGLSKHSADIFLAVKDNTPVIHTHVIYIPSFASLSHLRFSFAHARRFRSWVRYRIYQGMEFSLIFLSGKPLPSSRERPATKKELWSPNSHTAPDSASTAHNYT